MWLFAVNFGEILREFGENLGKYRILEVRSLGSIGFNSEKLVSVKIQ